MLKKLDLGAHKEVFAEPTPLGLIGLAIGCAALTPIAFGYSLTPSGLKTAAVFCLAFGAGCQFLAGMMNFANKNLWGGTILTAFSFNWALNWWALDSMAGGFVPDHTTLLAVDALFLGIFAVLTYGFGFFSKLLFFFLFDIDLLYLVKVARGLLDPKSPLQAPLGVAVGVFTIGLGVLALWIALATMMNPTVGRQMFRMPGPMFFAPVKAGFDFSLRRAIFDALYAHFQKSAFEPLSLSDLEKAVAAKAGGRSLLPDLHYLAERGGLNLSPGGGKVEAVRLTAQGIDVYEQDVLRKNG